MKETEWIIKRRGLVLIKALKGIFIMGNERIMLNMEKARNSIKMEKAIEGHM